MATILDKIMLQNWKQADQLYNTETMLPISEIQNDVIILKDGGLRSIIKVEWLNLDLRNDDDVFAVLEQYKKFINSLSFPIQILIRNTYLDLSKYINFMQKKINKIKTPLLKEQGKQYVGFLDTINNQQWLIYVKEFYIIVPFYAESDKANMIKKPRWEKLLSVLNSKEGVDKIVSRYRTFIKTRQQLDLRSNLIEEGLRAVGMNTQKLGLEGIVSLLFESYNPSLHVSQAEYKP